VKKKKKKKKTKKRGRGAALGIRKKRKEKMGRGGPALLGLVGFFFFLIVQGGAGPRGFLKPQPATRPAPHGYINF
jgi:hypothetical protein